MTTLIILNPHAGSGRAGQLWSKIEPLLWRELGELVVAVTQRPEDVAPHLEQAQEAGLTRVIAIGGDGTNHALINELIRLNRRYPDKPLMTFGSLPIGTGRDWARMIGVPLTPADAVRWIKGAYPTPLDAGQFAAEGGVQNELRHFLNIGSAGISGAIAQRINGLKKRHAWSFYTSTVEALLTYRPPRMKIKLDGQVWYDDKAYACVVANGQIFGHGMRIAPNAKYDDGLFDVILIEGVPRLTAIAALNSVYSGAHLKRSDVHQSRAKTVEIEVTGKPLGVELDGENFAGSTLRFDMLPGALSMLVHQPATSG